jgi:hypothetical protein
MEIREHGAFHALHAGLKVNMISTKREHFKTCRLEDNLQSVASQNQDKFDFMPVLQGGDGNDHIVGIVQLDGYFEAAAPDMLVSDALLPLHEAHLIGADASILSFIVEANTRPFRLLVSDQGVIGLVSLSDLQKLPVRAALFGLVTALEMAMVDAIRACDPKGEKWPAYISTSRRDDLASRIEKARRDGELVDELLFTEFCEKRDILRKLNPANITEQRPADFERKLKRIELLRNKLAHANDYAASRQKAAEVCATVRILLDMHERISSAVQSQSPLS